MCLSSTYIHHKKNVCSYITILQIDLVAQHDKREVLRITWAGLYEKLIAPRVQVLECVRCRHIKHQHTTVSASVEGDAKRLESFLASSVPNL